MGIKCCFGCVPPKRFPGCGATCPEYKAEKAENDRKREEERKRNRISWGIYEQRTKAVLKAQKKKRKR